MAFLRRYGAHVDPFLDIAKLLAYLLVREKGVSFVALTGSLARGETEVRDIDLIVLHTLGPEADFTCHINHNPSGFGLTHRQKSRDPVLTFLCDQTMRYLEWRTFLEERFSHGFVSVLSALCSAYLLKLGAVKVDLIFMHNRVLYDCEYLAYLGGIERFEDFYRRVFCEIPLLPFNPEIAEFEFPSLRHKDGKCCFPRRTWEDVKQEVKSDIYWGNS